MKSSKPKHSKTAAASDDILRDPTDDTISGLAPAAPPAGEKKLKVPARLKIRKDPSLPRRPLCAYNIFFKLQRKKILEERARARREGKLSKDEESLFSTMAKTIGGRWQSVSPETLQYCLDEAEQDKTRYQLEMRLFDQGRFIPASERQQPVELKPPPLLAPGTGSFAPPFAHGQLAQPIPQMSSADSVAALQYHLLREQELRRSHELLQLAGGQPSAFANHGFAVGHPQPFFGHQPAYPLFNRGPHHAHAPWPPLSAPRSWLPPPMPQQPPPTAAAAPFSPLAQAGSSPVSGTATMSRATGMDEAALPLGSPPRLGRQEQALNQSTELPADWQLRLFALSAEAPTSQTGPSPSSHSHNSHNHED